MRSRGSRDTYCDSDVGAGGVQPVASIVPLLDERLLWRRSWVWDLPVLSFIQAVELDGTEPSPSQATVSGSHPGDARLVPECDLDPGFEAHPVKA